MSLEKVYVLQDNVYECEELTGWLSLYVVHFGSCCISVQLLVGCEPEQYPHLKLFVHCAVVRAL